MPTYSIKAPNGKTYRISGPAGASDAAIQAEVLRQNPDAAGQPQEKPAPKAPAAPPEPPEASGFWQRTGMGLRAIGNGVAAIPDIVSAPLNWTANHVLGTNMSISPWHDLATAGSDKAGLHAPASARERLASDITSGVAGAMVPVAGAESTVARAGGAVTRGVLNIMRAKPLLQAASGATAAAAAGGAREMGAPPWLQIGAGIAGGFLPGAVGAGKAGLAGAYERTSNSQAPVQAARTIQGAATRPQVAAAAIRSAPRPIRGVQPTLAETARDPGLAALQRATPSPLLSERNSANAVARTNAVTRASGTGNPQNIQTAAQDTGATIADQATQARSAVGPVADRVETADLARQAFEENHGAAKVRTNAAYTMPELTTLHPVEIPKPVFEQIAAHANDFYGDGGGTMPEKLRSIIDDVSAPGATNRTFTNIDRRLADFAGENRMAGRNRDASFADSIRRTLDTHVEQTMPQDFRDALKTAKATRAEQGRIFETGPVASAMARDLFGNPTTGPAELPSRLVRPGPAGGDAATALTESTNPATAEATTRQELRRIIDEKGAETGAQVHALRTRYGETASRFPALASDLTAAEERAALNDAYRASPMGRMADANVDPATEVASMLTRKDGGRQLAALSGQLADNPQAISGLRRAIGQYAENASAGSGVDADGVTISDPAKARTAVRTILDRAGPALSDRQRVVLNRVYDELNGANFANGASRQGATPDTGSIAAMAHAVPGGRTLRATIGVLLRSFTNAGEAQKLVNKAILDPDFAAELLTKATPDNVARARAKLAVAGQAGAMGTVASQQ